MDVKQRTKDKATETKERVAEKATETKAAVVDKAHAVQHATIDDGRAKVTVPVGHGDCRRYGGAGVVPVAATPLTLAATPCSARRSPARRP